jgi:hypothetical protein
MDEILTGKDVTTEIRYLRTRVGLLNREVIDRRQIVLHFAGRKDVCRFSFEGPGSRERKEFSRSHARNETGRMNQEKSSEQHFRIVRPGV